MTVLRIFPGFDAVQSAAVGLVRIYRTGRNWERRAIVAGSVLGAGAIFLIALSANELAPSTFEAGGIAIAVAGLGSLASASISFEAREQLANAEAIHNLEERARSEPAEPKLAWDLARIKLESYLDRNLRQVSSIFYLVLLVMLFGMGLMGVGIWQALKNPSVITPAALAALAGVIVQVIGGTFLLIYRATMAQAKDYVMVLERINAVGMSINILDGIQSKDAKIKDAARVAIAQNLLGMYSLPTPGKARRQST